MIIAIAMLWYLASVGAIERSSLSGLAKAWQYTLIAISLSVIATALQALRLQQLINTHQLKLSFFAALKLTFIGLFFSTYLPGGTGGDLVKVYYASKGNPGGRTKIVTIVLLDRFIGLFSLLTLPLLLIPFFLDLIAAQAALQALMGASLAIACGIILASFVGGRFKLADSQFLQRIERKSRFGQPLIRMLHTLHFYRNSMNVIFRALFFSYVVQLLMVGAAMAVAQAINSAGADLKMLVLIPMAYLANSLPITPGGLGVGEAVLESLFAMTGLSGGAETILGWRLIMIIVGLLGLVFYLKGEQRFVFDQGTDGPADERGPM